MKGDAQPLIKYFDGSDKRFIIPLYQRNYDWTIDNCSQLFDDIMKLHRDPLRKSHFFGSIVSYIESGSEIRYIIDGQQRITTVSLILIALVNAYKDGKIKAEDPKMPEKIFKRYIVDEYQEDERKVKLKPIKNDMESFDALIYKEKDKYIQTSNVTKNYNFFYDKVILYGLSIDEYFKCISKLEIINIRLDDSDDPQLIFESLNSTGLDLKEADKIRNYLLMSLAPQEQNDLYTKYWNPIEEATHYEPTPFVRDYLTMKRGQIGRIDKIYFIFKDYAERQGTSRQDLLAEMHRYALTYQKIADASFGIEKIDAKLRQMRPLEPSVAYPFLLPFFDYAEGNLTDDEKFAVLDLIENYYSRRIICNLPSNALNKVFATLHREVINMIEKYMKAAPSGTPAPSYISVVTYQMLRKTGSSALPDDNDVADDFATRQVYKMPSNMRAFLLERMENRNSKETHDVINELGSKKISIEHIMPQTLSEDWKHSLGDDYDEIHKQYLHTMANLTLTGYNSTYSNAKFTDKRDMPQGFKDSAFRLNIFVKSCDKWTKEELDSRRKELIEVFFNIWPMPTTEFEPIKKEAESAGMDDADFEFTGRKIQAFIYHGVRYPIPTWKDMLVQVCGLVYLENRPTVEWVCANNKFCMHNESASDRTEFAPGHYVWSSNSTETKLGILRPLFDECGIDQSELVFEFLPDYAQDDEQSEEGTTSETTQNLKAQFWAGFLNRMRESDTYQKDFSNHESIPHYAWDLSIGKKQCSIFLVANRTMLRAGLYFNKKEDMSSLWLIQNEINESLSIKPSWGCFDKASNIVMERPFALMDKSSYVDAYEWLLARAIELKKLAWQYVK